MTSHQSHIETSAVVSNKIAWFVAIARCQYIGSQYRRMAKQAKLQNRLENADFSLSRFI